MDLKTGKAGLELELVADADRRRILLEPPVPNRRALRSEADYAALMEKFYREYVPGTNPGRALALAQRRLLVEPATENPYFWAGFELVGGR